MQYLEDTYTKINGLLFFWNLNLTEHPVFFLATLALEEIGALCLKGARVGNKKNAEIPYITPVILTPRISLV